MSTDSLHKIAVHNSSNNNNNNPPAVPSMHKSVVDESDFATCKDSDRSEALKQDNKTGSSGDVNGRTIDAVDNMDATLQKPVVQHQMFSEERLQDAAVASQSYGDGVLRDTTITENTVQSMGRMDYGVEEVYFEEEGRSQAVQQSRQPNGKLPYGVFHSNYKGLRQSFITCLCFYRTRAVFYNLSLLL